MFIHLFQPYVRYIGSISNEALLKHLPCSVGCAGEASVMPCVQRVGTYLHDSPVLLLCPIPLENKAVLTLAFGIPHPSVCRAWQVHV